MEHAKKTKLTICATFSEVLDAVMTLCGHLYIIAECALASGLPLLCLATPIASASKRVYVFDLLAIGSDSHKRSMLAALLTHRGIIKVVWDGTTTYRNIASALGVDVFPVLDVQMLEVIGRDDEGGGRKDDMRVAALATFGSRLLLRNRETIAGTEHSVCSADACVIRYALDIPPPAFTWRCKKYQDLSSLIDIASHVYNIARIMRAFTLAGILPDSNAGRMGSEDIIEGLQPLFDRSRCYITFDRLASGTIAFNKQLMPIAVVTTPPPSALSPTSKVAPTQHPIVGSKAYGDDSCVEIVEYEFCATPASILFAVSAVSQYPYVFVDCEGKELGSTGGVLSIISLGTPLLQQETQKTDVDPVKQKIYLIDVLALNTFSDARPRAAIKALLTSPIAKVVWDGRMDVIELSQHFCPTDAPLEPVIDLQIAEVVFGRGHDEAERKTRLRWRMGVGKYMTTKKQNSATAALFKDLHVVLSLDSTPSAYGIDTPVKKLSARPRLFTHSSSSLMLSSHWPCMHTKHTQKALFGDAVGVLERPAPVLLLDYAAVDIRLLGRVYAHFAQRGIVPANDVPALRRLISLSARYVSRNGVGGRAVQNAFHIGWLLSLDAITASLEDAVVCEACGARMPLECFDRAYRARREQCRVCVAAALSEKKSEAHREAVKAFHATWVEDRRISES